MASFDVVSDVDLMEIENAINQAQKEIDQRFDFRGGKSSIDLDKKNKAIKLLADDEMKMRSMHQIIEIKMAKRDLDLRCLSYGKEESAGGQMLKQTASIKSGLDKEEAKKVTKLIKDSKLKVQAQVQDQQVRVSGKKIDDLQEVIATLRAADLDFPLQFINMRS